MVMIHLIRKALSSKTVAEYGTRISLQGISKARSGEENINLWPSYLPLLKGGVHKPMASLLLKTKHLVGKAITNGDPPSHSCVHVQYCLGIFDTITYR